MADYKIARKKLKKNIVKLISIFYILSLLIGCGGNAALRKSGLATIKSVSICENVTKPGSLIYSGRKQAFLAVCGCLGGLAGGLAAEKTASKIKTVMEQEKIDVGEIVREQFVNELKNSNLFASIVSENSDAEFKLSIRTFGFIVPQGFSSKLKPILGVEGKLVKSDGSVLWEKYEFISNLSKKTPSYSLENYFDNPELIREVFTIASQSIVADLIE